MADEIDKEWLHEQVKTAREACGCMQCQGGYDLGGRTLAASMHATKPSSCLAMVVLDYLLDPPLEEGGEDD